MIRESHQLRHHLDSFVAHVLELGMVRDADDLALVGAQPRQRLRRKTAQVTSIFCRTTPNRLCSNMWGVLSPCAARTGKQRDDAVFKRTAVDNSLSEMRTLSRLATRRWLVSSRAASTSSRMSSAGGAAAWPAWQQIDVSWHCRSHCDCFVMFRNGETPEGAHLVQTQQRRQRRPAHLEQAGAICGMCMLRHEQASGIVQDRTVQRLGRLAPSH